MYRYTCQLRSGGRTGDTYYNTRIFLNETGEMVSEHTEKVSGRTVYETLFLATDCGLRNTTGNIIFKSNSNAFVMGMQNKDSGYLDRLSEPLDGRDISFRYAKLEKIRHENSSAMNIPIDAPSDYDIFFTSEDMAARRRINRECADGIIRFYTSDYHTYQDYIDLKTYGKDVWSEVDGETFRKRCSREYETAAKYTRGINIVYVMRWYQRGLSLNDAIRKVLVDEDAQKRGRKEPAVPDTISRQTVSDATTDCQMTLSDLGFVI